MSAIEIVVDVLLANGWTPAGHTESETVRIPTTRAPVYGGIGGEVRTFGGRARFAKGERRRVTVGARTTCFYEVVDKKAQGFVSLRTKDIDRIKAAAQN